MLQKLAYLSVIFVLLPMMVVAGWAMSPWLDALIPGWVDWLGGYPFEVSTPTATFDFLRARGFRMDRLVSTLGHGCNEFVFTRDREVAPARNPRP